MEKTNNFDLRVVGFEQCVNPWNANVTSPRSAMHGSQSKQVVHIHGNEVSRVLSGAEIHYGDLQLSPSLIPAESTLLKRIPKLVSGRSTDTIGWTFIYYTNHDLQVHYCDVDNYTLLNHGETFGYRNTLQNMHKVVYGTGSLLQQGTEFAVSPAIIDGMYCPGVNVNTIFTSHTEVLNDGDIISQDLADKLESIGFSHYTISLSKDDFPLNIYGTPDDYRILPNIDEQIENGILFAYRTANETTCTYDLTMENLSQVQYLHDNIFYCPPGSSIVDIKVYINPGIKLSDDKKFQQLVEIRNAQLKYYKEILQVYDEIKDFEYQLSDGFLALVTQAIGLTKRDNKFKLRSKDTAVEFVEIEIVVSHPRLVNAGNKLTDDSAAKGVIGEACIWPTENMPITESGIRADMIIALNSPFNRLIGGPWYSQFINYASELIQKRIVSGEIPSTDAYSTILEFKRMVSPLDHEWMMNNLITFEDQSAFVDEIKSHGMYHKILPYSKHINSQLIVDIMERFNIQKENWSYVNPHTKERVYSKYPTIIGSRYVYLLGKLPEKSIRGGQFGFVNQFRLPMRESALEKQRTIHSHTPIRIGTDEVRTIATNVDVIRLARLLAINGNSYTGVRKLQDYLLTAPKPSTLFRLDMTTRELLDDCTNIALFKHMMACAGFQMKTNPSPELCETNFHEYPIPQLKRLKAPALKGSKLVKIIMNDGREITNIPSLYNFTIVDQLMKKKLSYGHTLFHFEDGSVCRVSTTVAIIHMILWDVYLHFNIIPTKEDVFELGNIDKNWVSKIYTKIYYRLFDIDNHMYVLERMCSNINYLNNFNELYCGEYNSTLCAIDIAETLHHPYMVDEILAHRPDETHTINHIESTLRHLTKKFTNAVHSNELPSELQQFLETESLKVDQISQFLIAIGVRDDIDSRTVRHVVKTGVFEGLQTVEDFAVESLSGKKSAYYGKSSIQDAGVLGKYTRNVGESQLFLYDGHCGNTHTSPIVILPEWRNAFLNRRIIHKGQEILLTPDNIKQYINIDIDIISPIHCKHEFGICSHCVGYGPVGVLKRFISYGTNLGCSSTSQITQFITQFILSSKHLSKTDSFVYSLPSTAIPFLEKHHGQGGIVWKKSITHQLRNFSLLLRAEQLGTLDDLQHNIKSASMWSSLDEIGIYNTETEEIVGSFHINDGLIRPYLANPMLTYMKRTHAQLSLRDIKGQVYVVVPLQDYDFNTTPFKYVLLNKDMRQYVKHAQTFFNSKIEKLNQDNVLMEAYRLIFEKKLVNSHITDIVLKAFRKERIETENHYNLQFATTDEILKRNIPSKLQHIKVDKWLSSAETFTKRNTPGCYDALFGF